MRPHPVRRRPNVRRPAAALLALGVLACSDGPLNGPGLPGRGASLRLEPRVEPRASVAAAGISQVRVAISRLPDGLVVLDSVIDLVGQGGAELDLAVPLASSSDRFAVRLAAADAAGDTIFRAADTTEVVRGPAAPSLELLLRYAGPDTAVVRIVAGPDTAVLDAGSSAPLWVVGYPAGTNDATPLAHVAWRSGDETVARVSRTGGHVTAIAPGRAAWVYATTATGLVDSARVVVRHVLATLEASPGSLALAPGGAAQVAVAGRSSDGTALPADALTWSSSDTTVAVVDGHGRVLAVGVGGAAITATSGGARVAVPIAVALPAVAVVELAPRSVSLVRLQRTQLVATPRLADGTVARGRATTWTTSDATVATVAEDGVVSAVGVGVATVTATVGGRSADAEVEVSPLPADDLVASPETVQLIVGESRLLAAITTDSTGQPVPNTPIAWTTSNAGVAAVSGFGQLTAAAPGTATVTASANGRTSTVDVTVLPIPVDSVLLSRITKFDLVVGTATDLDATPLAADGAPLAGRAVAWSSSTPSVATVDANGGVVAVSPGKTFVTATSEGVASSVKVDVVPVPVASVAVNATSVSLLAGEIFQLRADAQDALGRLLSGRVVSWSSSDPSIAGVAIDGLVTAKRAGIVTVTASVEGRTATATITVTAPPVPASAVVAFTPVAGRYALGQTMGAQSVGLTADRGPTTLQLATWDGSVASVQPTVSVTGTTPTAFTVTGRGLGATTLQGTSAVATMGTASIEVVSGRLRVEGWAGVTMDDGSYLRIRLYPGGVDGSATDATFAVATPLAIQFDERNLDVYEDAAPWNPVGPASGSDRDGGIDQNDTITAAAGSGYVSLLIRGRNPSLLVLGLAPEEATMRVIGPQPGWIPLDLAALYVR